MGAKSKFDKVRSAAHKSAAMPPGRLGRGSAPTAEGWEQTVQVPGERDDEIDCLRIVRGEGGRSLPLYYDDYN